MWWPLEVLANLLISVAYFAISYAILAPLVREGQLRANRLGAATAAIFFSCAVGHGMHGIHPLLFSLGDHSQLAISARVVPAHEALWDAITAAIGIYYWTLRRTYGGLMRGAALFADLEEQRRTQEVRSQEALREAHDLFSGVLDATTEQSIIGTDLHGRVTVFNVGAQRMLGYSEEQMLGRVPDELFDRAETAKVAEELGVEPGPAVWIKVLGDRPSDTRQWTYLTAEGRRLTVMLTVTAMHDAGGEVTGYITVGVDVTEQRLAEQVLEDERRRLREAQSIGHTGSWERDLETGTVSWSETMFDLYGVDRDTPAGDLESGLKRVHPDDREMIRAAMAACVETGEPLRARYRLIRPKDGEVRWFEVRGEPVYRNGRRVRIGGAVADVTEEVMAAEELEAARDIALEASRQKSAFLATMSHEIRTPMNAVIGMTGLLLDTGLDDDQREFVETVRTSGDSLLCIINDILDFSKIEAGGLQLEELPFDLRSCIEDSLELVAATSSAKGLELAGHIDTRCPTRVVGDVTRLRQVLVNLLSNAVKFTVQGEVILTVEPDQQSEGDNRLRFAVTDTGIGIPPDRLEDLFNSFSQVDASTTRIYGGTGLGLAISQRLVQAMGGTIGVDSVSDMGSSFHFSVALAPPAIVDEAAPLRPASTLGGRNALVVDDNPTNRRILRLQLEGWGMAVTEAASGAAALKIVRDGQRFDVAVLDMKMPDMNGIDLAVSLRSAPDMELVPMILLSSREHRQRFPSDDLFTAVLTKPVRSARLRHSLRDALRPGGPGSPAFALQASPTGPERVALRVLLAEDNAVNQRLGRLMLEKLGNTVEVVGNGREAIEAVRRVPYDVVLMDVEMPVMDGLEATRIIRDQMPAAQQPQIVAMTASVLVEDRRACDEAGMDDYLAKPVRIQDLADALGRVAASRDGPSTAASAGTAGSDRSRSAGMPTPSDPAVDRQVIDDLIGDLGADGADDVAGLIVTYLSESDRQLASLEAAVADHDLPLAGSLAHKMKSATALLGARTLAGLLDETCTTARTDGVGLERLTALVDAEHRRVVADMAATLKRLGPDQGP